MYKVCNSEILEKTQESLVSVSAIADTVLKRLHLSMKSMWNVQKTLQLIEDVHRAPCLWDRRSEQFKNRAKKRETINILAEKNGVTSAELERKIHSMKTQFYRERRKLFNAKRNNIEHKKSNWFGYEPLMFLSRKCETKCVRNTNIKESEIEVSSNNNEIEKAEDTGQVESGNDMENYIMPIPEYGRQEVQQNGNNVDSTQILECSKCLTTSNRDEFSTFGEYIACTLRSCNRQRREIATAQHHINSILFNLEMGVYSNTAQHQLRNCNASNNYGNIDTDGEHNHLSSDNMQQQNVVTKTERNSDVQLFVHSFVEQ